MKHQMLGYDAQRRLSLPPLSGGVDYALPPHLIRDDRLSDAVNVWWHDGMLRTRPAVKQVGYDHSLTADAAYTVMSLYDRTVIHIADGNEHRFVVLDAEGDLYGNTVIDSTIRSMFAVPMGQDADLGSTAALLYISDSGNAHTVRTLSDAGVLNTVLPYVPNVLSAGRATAAKHREENGALIEPLNLLTPAYTCRYTTDGEGIYYWLPKGVDVRSNAPLTVKYTTADGKTHSHTAPAATDVRTETATSTDGLLLRYEPSQQCFYFLNADKKPTALPVANAADNLVLSSECVRSERFNRIYKMQFGTWFGGNEDGVRLFVSGNPDTPHLMHWSAPGDPLYFPENNYAYVGDASSAVTAFGKQSELLVIFKQHEVYAATYRDGNTVTADALLSGEITDTQAVTALFPIRQIHSEIGCDCPATLRLCGERLVWMTTEGRVYALYTGGTYDARRVQALSRPIEPLLADIPLYQRRQAAATRYGDRYVLAVDGRFLVLDYTSAGFDSANTDDVVWFVWESPLTSGKVLNTVGVRGQTYMLLQAPSGAIYVMGFDVNRRTDFTPEFITDTHTQFSARPIFSRLSTKQYELGAPERYKQVSAVTVWMSGDVGDVTQVVLSDGADQIAAGTVIHSGVSSVETPPRRIAVNAARTQNCGITLENEGYTALHRVQLLYRRKGEIRE